jgi:hypothetical protein
MTTTGKTTPGKSRKRSTRSSVKFVADKPDSEIAMFIELHSSKEPQPFLISISHIIRVVEEDGKTFIHFAGSDDPLVLITESYNEVSALLREAGASIAPKKAKAQTVSDEALATAKRKPRG